MQNIDDPLAARRRRALFRSQRRGTKESDLVIGGFARAHVGGLDAVQLDRFEALLERNDPEVLGWVIGLEAPPAEFDTDVLKMIRDFNNHLKSIE